MHIRKLLISNFEKRQTQTFELSLPGRSHVTDVLPIALDSWKLLFQKSDTLKNYVMRTESKEIHLLKLEPPINSFLTKARFVVGSPKDVIWGRSNWIDTNALGPRQF